MYDLFDPLNLHEHLSIIHPPLPSGTRIIYDRKFLLECRSSPLARTPPCSLPNIPGVTSPPSKHINNVKAHNSEPLNNNITAPADKSTGDDAQFEMDI
nr:eukaryotic translation initiation factor 4E-binding protein 3-like [Salvelinus alpinus]